MDLQTIRERIQRKGYTGREDFLADVALIKANSELYNGPDDMLTLYASKLLEFVCLRFSENEETLMHLEKAINPLIHPPSSRALRLLCGAIAASACRPLALPLAARGPDTSTPPKN